MYRPTESRDMKVPFMLMNVTEYEKIKGVSQPKDYEDVRIIYCNFKTYGGTQENVNGRYSIIDTAEIVTRYAQDIKSDSKLKRMSDGAVFGIMNEPENIDMKNFLLKFKVKRIKGKA